MRASSWLIAALALATITGCGLQLPASPTIQLSVTPLPLPSVVAGATNSPATVAPSTANGFAIYLLTGDAPALQPADAGRLDLEELPIVSLDEIVSYNQEAHEIELTDSGYETIHSLTIPVNGRAFAVCIDGRPIYTGAFWASYSSLSFDGIVIDSLRATKEKPVIQIALGYPGPDFFHGEDPRSNPDIMQALKQAGKLK